MPNRENVLPADLIDKVADRLLAEHGETLRKLAEDDAIDAYRVEIAGLQTQCYRLLRLIGQAVDSEMGWQDVTELQTFLREGARG